MRSQKLYSTIFYYILLSVFQKYKRTAKLLMLRSHSRKKRVCSKSVTKKLYWNKFLVSECNFKIVCHCESCRLSETDCVQEISLKHL